MSFEFDVSFDETLQLMQVVTRGPFGVDTHEGMMAAMVSHQRWKDVVCLLADHSQSTAGALSSPEVIRIAELTRQYFDGHWPKYFAIVMHPKDSPGIGNATLWQVVASAEAPSTICMFTGQGKAVHWLRECVSSR